MTPVHQTIFGPPHGNCFQAAIASVFDLPLEAVPNFVATPGDGPEWWDAVEAFCRERGVAPVYVAIDRAWQPHGYHLIDGKSPRGDFYHVVVGHKGEMVHDPHPDGTGVVVVEGYIIFEATLDAHP